MSAEAIRLMPDFDYSTFTDPAAAAWAANHDGKIDAYWREQWRVNAEIKEMIRENLEAWHGTCLSLEKKVDDLTKRVFYMMGVAGAVGAIVTLLAQGAIEALRG